MQSKGAGRPQGDRATARGQGDRKGTGRPQGSPLLYTERLVKLPEYSRGIPLRVPWQSAGDLPHLGRDNDFSQNTSDSGAAARAPTDGRRMLFIRIIGSLRITDA